MDFKPLGVAGAYREFERPDGLTFALGSEGRERLIQRLDGDSRIVTATN